MILGRNPALWAGLVAALLNVAVIVFGIPLSTEGVAALNGLAIACIAVLANTADPTTQPTFALTLKAPTTGNPPSPSTTGSSSGGSSDPSAGSPDATTPDPTAGGPAAGAGS